MVRLDGKERRRKTAGCEITPLLCIDARNDETIFKALCA
jgi:hypothetical protein